MHAKQAVKPPHAIRAQQQGITTHKRHSSTPGKEINESLIHL